MLRVLFVTGSVIFANLGESVKVLHYVTVQVCCELEGSSWIKIVTLSRITKGIAPPQGVTLKDSNKAFAMTPAFLAQHKKNVKHLPWYPLPHHNNQKSRQLSFPT